MNAPIAAGAGFLLAVLWFDLMFDFQVLRHRGAAVIPERVLASIAAYYRRVTTEAQPMGALVAAVMVLTLGLIVAQIAAGDDSAWIGWSALALVGSAVLVAAIHTVPAAVRLGSQADSPERQSTLARSICRDHIYCVAAVASVLTIELSWG